VTKDDGDSTVLPIIFCPGCNGGKGIAVWNLPPTPSIVFNLPGLPEFSLPCLLGDCGGPKNEEGDNGGGGKGGGGKGGGGGNGGDEQEEDDGDEEDTTTTSNDQISTIPTSSESTSSTTSSCSGGTTTATDCRVGCSLSYSTIDSSVSSTTVCYSKSGISTTHYMTPADIV
jgi:hypothetical protein